MTKKMKRLLADMDAKTVNAKTLADAGDEAGATVLLDEADALKTTYDLEARLFAAAKAAVPDAVPPAPEGEVTKQVNGFDVISKLLRGRNLTADESAAVPLSDVDAKALGTDDLTTGGSHGESYVLPVDVRTIINELRRARRSAKMLVTVVPSTALTGSFAFEAGTASGLVSFEDGENVPNETGVSFTQKKFAIGLRGKLIPVTNLLATASNAGIIQYLNRWFVRNAIISENKDIFATLALGKTAVPLADVFDLIDTIDLSIDPDCLIDGVVVTNQTGFNRMAQATDENGHPYLQPDLTKKNTKLFHGLPVEVFSDAQLPNVGEDAPVFYGDTRAGCWFVEYSQLLFAASSHAGFNKNATILRVIEGYDVIGADKDAYGYGLLAVPIVPPAATQAFYTAPQTTEVSDVLPETGGEPDADPKTTV